MQKKEFWKYFFNTYKSSKWLLLRFLIISVYLTVTAIIANNMNLHNLTYYNAIIGFSAFADLIGLGISNGVGIFINQNIKDKTKVEYYSKYGLYVNLIFSTIFVVLLGIFYKTILHSFLGLPQSINYAFYFFMLFFIFLNCVLSYFLHTLKELKMFFFEVVMGIIQSVLMIVGFIIIWLEFNLFLDLIAGIYIFTTFVALVYSIIYFNHNKILKVNIFKPVKIKIIKSEAIIIWRMAAIQIVWQVGYSIIGFFILRINEVFYNQYAYFENVLDIFNGFFFSFVIVASIDICRNLGENKFKETYKIGKYSLYSTLIIWLFYFICCMVFSVPFINGMSVDIKSGAFVAMILYLIMYLFRFFSWNLISYILCWGGELKILVYQEIIVTLYSVGLYLLFPVIPSNIYLIYGLVTLPLVAQTIFGLIIFKRKNWMKNINEDNKIKVVVFDFDDTLYSGLDWNVWGDFCLTSLKHLFKNKTADEFKKIEEKFIKNGSTDEEIINQLIADGRSVNEWLEHRDNNIVEFDFSNCKVTSNETLKEFSDKYILYIVSNSTQKDIAYTAKKINLDLSVFKEIITNRFENGKTSKKVYYKEILEKENINASNMYVIGNSFEFDIQPALELSAKAKMIEHADFKISDFDL